ncbi:MAG: hypothetical protein L6Q76_17190 [Polyangiaceae bacterium]|nr:hypothetical protein [Polyangiaceae bacterium]
MRSFFLAMGIGAMCVAAYAGCGLTTEGDLADSGPTSTSTTTSTGTGMMDAGLQCMTADDCPPNSDCTTWACTEGACIVTVAPDDTPVATGAVQGDCKKNVCKDGKPSVLPDDTDLVPDNDPCTQEMCNGGVKQAGPAPDGTACGDTGQLACVAGLCQGCAQNPANCNAPTDCQSVDCPVNTCEYTVLDGKVLADPDQTDCVKVVCDAQGNQATVGDTTETPPQMGDICKKEICDASGNVAQMNDAEGQDCGNPMGMCYNEPACASGTCAQQPKMAGVKIGDNGVLGDCQATVCDGMGGMTDGPDNMDKPPDSDTTDCIVPTCVNGVPDLDATKNKGDTCTAEPSGRCCGSNCCANAMNGVSNYCDANDMCCPSNRACNGVCCTNGTASCVNNACCETGVACNNVCCMNSTASCHNNACCESAKVCNNVCCPTNHDCEPGGNSPCCPSSQRCPNGSCCPNGQTCNAGNQCN